MNWASGFAPRKLTTLYLMAALYTLAGIWHFVRPKIYLRIMPNYLPAPLTLVYASGLAEILLGIGLCFSFSRSFAAWGVIALLFAVFPANIYMLQRGGDAYHLPQWVLWARLPLQFVLMFWAWIYT